MGYDDTTLNVVFDKTGGHCEYCDKQLAWVNYGVTGARGAWEVDHSRPKSRGGTDHLNNLFPACTGCNRRKSDMPGTQFRQVMQAQREDPLDELLKAGFALGAVYLGLKLMEAVTRGGRRAQTPRRTTAGLDWMQADSGGWSGSAHQWRGREGW